MPSIFYVTIVFYPHQRTYLEREMEGEREGRRKEERKCPRHFPWPGIEPEPKTQVDIQTGNQTCKPFGPQDDTQLTATQAWCPLYFNLLPQSYLVIIPFFPCLNLILQTLSDKKHMLYYSWNTYWILILSLNYGLQSNLIAYSPVFTLFKNNRKADVYDGPLKLNYFLHILYQNQEFLFWYRISPPLRQAFH